MSLSSPLPPPRVEWWDRDYHAARRVVLLQRNQTLRALRDFFTERGFTEVETAILQFSPGNETHLHAFETAAQSVCGDTNAQLYLHTSPEFAAKKLMSAGEKKIFTLARCFRNREQGSPLHAREFTMLEWYRAEVDFTVLIEDCIALIGHLGAALNIQQLKWGGATLALDVEPQIITLTQAFQTYAGIDLHHLIDETGAWQIEPLRKAAISCGLRLADDDSAGDIFSRLMTAKIEPHLGCDRLTFLTHYPVEEAALARVCPNDGRFAERFELYACGVELANAFGELTDATEQRRRFELAMDDKQRIYGIRYPLDEGFLNALAQMPPASGIALGFDRLLMLLTGAAHVDQVIWAP